MSRAQPGARVEIELEEFGSNVWTDVTADVRMIPGIRMRRGIRGNGPKDRAPSVGTASFVLDNSGSNSGGLRGYYSPNHTNVREGFAIGKRARLSLRSGSTVVPHFIGTIDGIRPTAGARRAQDVMVSLVDWFEEPARWKLRGLPIQLNKRGEEIIQTIIDAMPRSGGKPTFEFDEGQSTFVYAMDSAQDESNVALQEFSRAIASEFGYLYERVGTLGQRLIFEDRHHRYNGVENLTNLVLFDNSMAELAVSHAVSTVFNRIQVTAHPRRLGDSDTEVLYTLEGRQQSVAPGQTITIRAAFTDPTQRAVRIGAVTTQPVVATTDYQMNTAADGTGTNLTASFTVSVEVSGNSALFTITNTHATLAAFITMLQIRGRPIYDYSPAIAEVFDQDSIDLYGERSLKFDMPYQDSSAVAQGAAEFLLDLYRTPRTYVDAVTFHGVTSAEMLDQLLALDIGHRIGLSEDMTGLEDEGYFIQSLDWFIGSGNYCRVTYTVTPATEPDAMWLLGVDGSSELGETTFLSSF